MTEPCREDGPACLQVGFVLHAHPAQAKGTCAKHGPGQPLVAVDADPAPIMACRACWADVYANVAALLKAATEALPDLLPRPVPHFSLGLGLADAMANLAAGRCWCGQPHHGHHAPPWGPPR